MKKTIDIFSSSTPYLGDNLYLEDYEIAARKMRAQEFARVMNGLGRFLGKAFAFELPVRKGAQTVAGWASIAAGCAALTALALGA